MGNKTKITSESKIRKVSDMNKNISIAAIAGVAAAGPLGGGLGNMDYEFIQFTNNNNKNYHSVGEFQRRAAIFNNNQAIIDGLNAQSQASGAHNAAKYEMNQFGDMEDGEFQD